MADETSTQDAPVTGLGPVEIAETPDGQQVEILTGTEKPAQAQVIGVSHAVVVAGLAKTQGVDHIPGFGGDRSDLLRPIKETK